MKVALLPKLLKAVVPAFAVATCGFAAVALNASSTPVDIDTDATAEVAAPLLKISKNTHFVHLTESKEIVGRLKTLTADDFSAARDVKVHFVQDGRAAAVVEPNHDGLFKVSGLGPGRYSVVTAGADGLAAYSVAVLPFDGQLTELSLDSAAVPRQDFEIVGNVIRSEVYSDLCTEYCSQQSVPSITPAPAPEIQPLPAPPVEVKDPIAVSYRPASTFQMPEADTIGEAGAVLKQQPVKLAEDGSLNGRIHWLTDSAPHQLPASGARVSLVSNGEVVRTAETNVDGIFTMAQIDPGTYSVVATCPSQVDGGCTIDAGACCSAIQCVPQTYTESCCPQFDAALVGCTDMGYTMDTFCESTCAPAVIEEPIVEPGTIIGDGAYMESPVGFGGGGGYYGGGGGSYGGFGGGGGGFGGGGGLGALGPILGAGLGAGGIALLDDDDDSGAGLGGGGGINSPAAP